MRTGPAAVVAAGALLLHGPALWALDVPAEWPVTALVARLGGTTERWLPVSGGRLWKVDLASTGTTDADLALLVPLLKRVSSLEVLSLAGTRVTDRGLETVGSLTGLRTLNLNSTRVSDKGLASLGGLRRLRRLELASTAVTDRGLAQLKGVGRLQFLVLGGKVGDAGLAQLKAVPTLRYLYLMGSTFTDAGLVHLRGLPQLRALAMSYTKITEAGLKKLRRALPELEVLP